MSTGAEAAAAGGLVFPAVGSPPNYRRSVSIIKFTYSGPPRQVVIGDGSSSSSLLRVVSHILPKKSSSQTPQGSLPKPGLSSSFAAGGGMMSSREDDTVSTSGRAWANAFVGTIRIGLSSSSGNGNRLQSKSNAGPDVLPSLNPNEAEEPSAFVARDQSLEAPSPYPEENADGGVGLDVTDAAGAQESSNENENSLRTMEERLDALAAQKSTTPAEVMMVSLLGQDPSIPTMQDIIATAAQEGVKLQVMTFGPTFQIVVSNLDETQTFGKADGWIKWWWPKGKILHLESVKLERGLSKQVGNVGGAGFFVGAATLRYGFDEGCRTAELLAIYDDEVTHGKGLAMYEGREFCPEKRSCATRGKMMHGLWWKGRCMT